MEENTETVIYENYKFLTKEDLERLNLTNLIGTNLLKAYMHGYFVDYGLYKKVNCQILLTTLYYVCWSPKVTTREFSSVIYILGENFD